MCLIAVVSTPAHAQTIQSEKYTFRAVTLVRGLQNPWSMAFLPDGRMLVTEREGRLRIVSKDFKLDPKPVEGLPEIVATGQGGLFDVAIHPQYPQNGWIYWAYNASGPGGWGTTLARGKLDGYRMANVQILFSLEPKTRTGQHFGGRIVFDGKGMVYLTLGDRGEMARAQKADDHAGSVIRLHDDGRVPADNPFVNRAGALGSVWSYGHRHPQGLQFHPGTGRFWSTEHGPSGGDEINVIDAGHNYGWPLVSSGTDARRKYEASRPDMDSPLAFWTPSIAPGGIEFYTGNRFPRWKNSLFIAGLGGQQLRRLETDGDRVAHQEVLFRELGRVREVVTGPDGLLYLALNAPDRLARLVPTDETAPSAPVAAVTRSVVGRTPEGTDVELFTLTNRHGAVAKIMSYGAILADLRVRDRDGKLGSVVREITPSEQGFARGFPQAGAVFGRVANRIANARFTLDGREVQVTPNSKPNHIHGGTKNFSRVVWTATPATAPGIAAVTLTYVGAIVDQNNMKGIVDFGGMGGATFTAVRKQ